MSWRCQRFRAAFTPDAAPTLALATHRERCADCAGHASALERAAAADQVPLPPALRGRLRAIHSRHQPAAERPAGADAAAVPLRLGPLPAEPLPGPLRDRLQAIARPAAPPARVPLWVLQARYAVAASALLVTLAGAAFGNPLDHGREWTHRVSGAVGKPLAQGLREAQDEGREQLAGFRDRRLARWWEAVLDRLALAGDALAAAPAQTGALLDRVPNPFDFLPPTTGETTQPRRDGPDEPVEESSDEP